MSIEIGAALVLVAVVGYLLCMWVLRRVPDEREW